MDLKGKTALVTGSGRGLGKAMADRMGSLGANLVISDIVSTSADETAAELAGRGYETMAMAADVSNREQVAALIEAAVERFGTLEIVVNNAGITKDTLLLRMTEEAWDQVMAVNLKGPFLVTQAAAKIMIKNRYGRIINISSVIGRMGNPGQANYAASKAGIIGLTKSAARELASRGITVNAVAPGFIETEMTQNLPQAVRDTFMDHTPLKKFGSTDDVAAMVAFLASDEAAYITGQVIGVDGGLLMC